MSERPKCENCKWWDRANSYGQCHRHAPVPHPEQGMSARWPWTSQYDACGDHEKKEERR